MYSIRLRKYSHLCIVEKKNPWKPSPIHIRSSSPAKAKTTPAMQSAHSVPFHIPLLPSKTNAKHPIRIHSLKIYAVNRYITLQDHLPSILHQTLTRTIRTLEPAPFTQSPEALPRNHMSARHHHRRVRFRGLLFADWTHENGVEYETPR